MIKNRKPRWLVVKIAIGLIALALLWLPLGEGQAMTFSGPTRISKSYGILSYLTVVTHYKPRRMGLRLGGITRDVSQLMEEGDAIWSQDDSGVILVRVTDHALTLNGWSLALTGALTALATWLAMIRPVRGYLRTCRSCSLQPESRVGCRDKEGQLGVVSHTSA